MSPWQACSCFRLGTTRGSVTATFESSNTGLSGSLTEVSPTTPQARGNWDEVRGKKSYSPTPNIATFCSQWRPGAAHLCSLRLTEAVLKPGLPFLGFMCFFYALYPTSMPLGFPDRTGRGTTTLPENIKVICLLYGCGWDVTETHRHNHFPVKVILERNFDRKLNKQMNGLSFSFLSFLLKTHYLFICTHVCLSTCACAQATERM